MGYISNGVETGGAPFELIYAITQGFKAEYFIETGTASGESTSIASDLYEVCHTIDVNANTAWECFEYGENVTFHVGNSVHVLPEIISQIPTDEYVVFWLDAHYSDSVPAQEDIVECPTIDEIQAISPIQKAVIVIDDARLFLGTPPPPMNPTKWSSIFDIFTKLHNCFPNHHITIVDDYVLCIPNEMKGNLNKEWIQRFSVRYPPQKQNNED